MEIDPRIKKLMAIANDPSATPAERRNTRFKAHELASNVIAKTVGRKPSLELLDGIPQIRYSSRRMPNA